MLTLHICIHTHTHTHTHIYKLYQQTKAMTTVLTFLEVDKTTVSNEEAKEEKYMFSAHTHTHTHKIKCS